MRLLIALSKETVTGLGILAVVLAGCSAGTGTVEPSPDSIPEAVMETFEECAEAGYPIMEIYPEQCQTPDGRIFTRVTPQEAPAPVTMTGVYNCLPKRATGGPVTLECAFGLESEGVNYALDMSGMPTEDYPIINTGETITVEGLLVPLEMISSDRFQTYDVAGVIAVNRVAVTD